MSQINVDRLKSRDGNLGPNIVGLTTVTGNLRVTGIISASNGFESVVSISTTPPSSPGAGDLWWDDIGGQLYIYYTDSDSSQWVQANGSGGLPEAIDVDSSAPADVLIINSSGEVGIGTDVLAEKLGVLGDTKLDGNLTVTGIVTGNLTGDVTGNLTGDVTGIVTATGGSITGVSTIGTTNLTVNGNAYPSAGPLSNRNKIINGDMRIDQRNAGTSVTPTNAQYLTDRWKVGATQSSKFTAQQSTVAQAGFKNSLLLTSSSAYTLISSDEFDIIQFIEGNNVVDCSFGTADAQTLTLSFYARSSLTGTFGGCIYNGSSNRSYPFTYSISAVNTWEPQTVTFVGDTSGTWATDNTAGINVLFSLGAGSNNLGTAGAWTGSFKPGATGQTNLVATNGATLYLTGVQLEVGSVATPFEHRSYGDELARCERYFQKSYRISEAPGSTNTGGTEWFSAVSSGRIAITSKLQTRMRAEPVIKVYDWAGNVDRVRTSAGNNQTTFSIQVASDTAFTVDTQSTNVSELLYQYTAQAEL